MLHQRSCAGSSSLLAATRRMPRRLSSQPRQTASFFTLHILTCSPAPPSALAPDSKLQSLSSGATALRERS
eukprot:2501102-Rhodomonas_salina.2